MVGHHCHQPRACVDAGAVGHAHAPEKETDGLDDVLCYLVDYESVKPSLYIDLQYI